ncbi:MAG: peptidoglycan DD-metalloendopeptidase family protein [Pyrinomonadaceae bacterium]
MNINQLDNSPNPFALNKNSSSEELRRAARQFEAILLNQLTSALNTSNDDEDSLFGSDGGTGLAKQMFAEQLASTMAESGGVGLADLIMKKFGAGEIDEAGQKKSNFSGALAAVREIKGSDQTGPNINGEEFQVISTYAETIASDPTAEPLENALLDGKIRDSTRPRIVPENFSAGDKMVLSPVAGSAPVEYEMPLTGRISSSFGNRFHPIDKKVKFHTGVDIAVPRGTPISSAAEGVVKFAGRKGGYGNVVIIEHPDGRETFYAHADKLLVKKGQVVSGGQEIAKAGSTGKSTGPHLHFEVRENGKAIDPIKFLSNVLPKPAEK